MKSIFAIAAIAVLSALPAQAAITYNAADLSANVVDFEAYDGFETSGPELVAAAVTFTAAPGATLGAYASDLGNNGAWGVGNHFVSNTIGEMRFTFANMASGAGAYLNHYSDNLSSGFVTITAFGIGNRLLESYSVNLNTGFESYNAGQFVGFTRSSADIKSFVVTGQGVVMDNLSFAAPVPEPEAYAMLLAGLALMGTMARRRQQK
jgi:hypothetical protein